MRELLGPLRRSPIEVVSFGSDRFRIGTWRGDPSIGYLAPVSVLTASGIERAVQHLHHKGFSEIITSALSPAEQHRMINAGFVIHERLHLLRHDLHLVGPARHLTSRRARRRDRATVLRIDSRSFEPFWRLDDAGLTEAIGATPVSRFRVALLPESRSTIVGYTVAGRARDVTYLQRLAVDPTHQGAGYGAALIDDTLRWARRRRSAAVLVNTQESNETAFALYQHLGFVPQRDGLAVLRSSRA